MSKKRPIAKIILVSLLVILAGIGTFLYINFNRILADALIRSFNSNIASDVYELKFESLRLNFVERSIRVFNVSIQPREKPLRDYPYINSSFKLKTAKITLMKVELRMLLESNLLRLERISITKPDIEVLFGSINPVLLPFKDTTSTEGVSGSEGPKKRAIEAFDLKKFELIDASFRVTNLAKEREGKISNLNISINNLKINQIPGEDQVGVGNAELAVGEFTGSMQKGGIRRIKFKDFTIRIDSLDVLHTVDTLMVHFDDYNTGVTALDLHTADSLYHFTMESFNLSYRKKSINLKNLSIFPNISEAAMQRRFKYQTTLASGSVGSVAINNINFDSLIHYRSIFIDQIVIDNPSISIFKDNTKPMDSTRFPKYFGEQIRAIRLPLRIREVKVTHINLANTERKPDSTFAKVSIRRGTALAGNITNRSKKPMTLSADAYIDDKVHFNLKLAFEYQKPQFSFDGKFDKFNLPDLNTVIQAYTPAKITDGVADEISFAGTASSTNSTGTMKFLYHDLVVDLELKKQARWKSSVIAFAANSVVSSSNPVSDKLPPKIVKFQADRNMNKGFVNIIIRSALSGLKETMLMSKENKKAYKEAKKKKRKSKSGG